jgi:GT2 family glycosyltransferase
LNPTVSVIVRTVRRPQRLRECLQSLAAQTFILTARGLLPNRSISSRVSSHGKLSRLQSHSVAK